MNYFDVRRKFIDFYQSHNHQLLPRAPMLHPSIPMSFVMSAGLIQVETALERQAIHSGDKFVLVQDCFRHFDRKKVSEGKHHLSLFEMSGAFTFGVMDKAALIKDIWYFLTRELKIEDTRLWVTYFAGGQVGDEKLQADEATRDAWRTFGVRPEQIIAKDEKENFWMQGGSLQNLDSYKRKCGPNTEVFFDKGADRGCQGGCMPGCRCGRFLEISNLLFIKYEMEEPSGRLKLLDLPFAETVIGNERIAAVIQNALSVYDIKSYQHLRLKVMERLSSDDYLAPQLIQQSVNVLLDHLRALSVLIADGAPPPGKGGRAYIIKGLIRGVLTSSIVLDLSMRYILNDLLTNVVNTFGDHFTYNEEVARKIRRYFNEDELRFRNTLDKGKEKIVQYLENNGTEKLSPETIDQFEKKLGVPRVLIRRITEKNHLY